MKRHLSDADVSLIKGKDGVFDVTCDGDLIFSKHEQGRFPDSGEIFAAVEQRNAR